MSDDVDYDTAVLALETDQTEILSGIYASYQLSDESPVSARCAAITTERNTLESQMTLVTVDDYKNLPEQYQVGIAESLTAQKAAEETLADAQEALTKAQSKVTVDSETQQELIDEALKAVDDAYADYLTAFQAYQTALVDTSEEGVLQAKEYKATSDQAWDTYEEYVAAYDAAKEELTEIQALESDVSAAKDALESAEEAKEVADVAVNDALGDVTEQMQREDAVMTLLLLEIAEADVTYNEDGTFSVYAETAGTVSMIYASVGDSVATTDVLIDFVQANSTYSVSFNTSAQKANQLKVGSEAEVINADATAILKSIRNTTNTDSGNLNEKKLTFTVTGDVTDGQTLALKMNESSQKYEYTIPSNAVNEDSDGTFLWIVQTKSTPLGNRCYAKKVAVEVVADDGTNAAINGDISTDTYVICLCTEALANGDMVRMKETAE